MITSLNIEHLLEEQKADWSLAKNNFEALSTVKTKIFKFDNFEILVQFNPARIQSSAAKVDAKSIQERKCFLCLGNLPIEQKGLAYGEKYTILVNPFPIFPKHFTIPTNLHIDQLILDKYADMLDLAKSLDQYTLFYNGPKCGASAPDHAHFQAGNKGFLPLEHDVKVVGRRSIVESKVLKVYTLVDYLRNTIILESSNKEEMLDFFVHLYHQLELKEGEKEPMLNILTWYESGIWYSCIVPRENHRPTCFFAEGEDNLLISPASVDMGGVLITPQEKDFNKITFSDIEKLLKEVCVPQDKFEHLCKQLAMFGK